MTDSNKPMVDALGYPLRVTQAKSEEEVSELGYFDVVRVALGQSPIGVSLRQSFSNNLEGRSRYTPKDASEFHDILAKTGFNPDAMKRVLDNAKDLEDVYRNIEMYQEDKFDSLRLSKNSFVTQFVAGGLSMVGNPLDVATTVANPALGASKLVRVGTNIAYNVATGVASNYVTSKVTGQEQDIAMDIMTMTGFSASTHGLVGTKNYLNKNYLYSKGLKTSIAMDDLGNNPDTYLPSPSSHNKFARKVNDKLQWLNNKLGTKLEVRESLANNYGDVDEAREFVSKLFRFEQGKRNSEGFSTTLGDETTTAFDIKKSLARQNSVVMDMGAVARKEADDLGAGDEFSEYVTRKVAGEDVSSFTNFNGNKTIDKYAEKLKEHYKYYEGGLVQRGIIRGKALYDEYAPRAINRQKMTSFIKTFKGDAEAGKWLASHLKKGVLADPKRLEVSKQLHKQELDDYLADPKTNPNPISDFNEWLNAKTREASLAYRDLGAHGKGSDNYNEDAKEFSFSKKRMPWNWGYKDSDTGFSMYNVAEDVNVLAHRYSERASGAIASKDGLGKEFNEVLNEIKEIHKAISIKDGRDTTRADAFSREAEMMLRRLYGMPINPEKLDKMSYGDALAEVLRNVTFGSFSTFMGLLSYGEMTEAIKAYGAGIIIKSIPYADKLATRWTKGEFTSKDKEAIHNSITGSEVREILGYGETLERTLDDYHGIDGWTARIVAGSRMFATHSPGAYLLRSTQRSIVDTVNEQFLSELMKSAHGKPNGLHHNFQRDKDWKRAGVTAKERDAINNLLKEHSDVIDGNVRLKDSFKDAIRDNPDVQLSLRKMTEYVSNECIQRRGIDDVFSYEYQNNPLLTLAMQFKSFALLSFNKRLVKLGNRWEEEGTKELMTTLAYSTALSGIVNTGITGIRTLGMSEEDRDSYLQRALGIEDFDIKRPDDVLEAFLTTGVYRNPYWASLALAMNTFGVGTGAKTTSEARGFVDDTGFISSFNAGQNIMDMLPSARIINNAVNGFRGIANYMMDGTINDDYTYAQKQATAKQLMSGMSILPNIPWLTNWLKGLAKENAEDYTYN